MEVPAARVATAKEVEKKVELMKEVRAREVAIGELNNLPPSRAAYQKTCNIFFRKNIKTAVISEQSSSMNFLSKGGRLTLTNSQRSHYFTSLASSFPSG
ncbi:hypothetical protein BRADI_1g28680v3 [Brachypodium distachyon]|uniref:Uncharacterized protein n=1 Tax=Brachypodium distachyon TaxID=15368 RepID=I1GUR9_BRADI|nr:hypothetical protein BRADI_1g28680v3 [Brachypodium distachyon]